MRTRSLRLGRERWRREFILQLLTAIGVGVGGAAIAQETELAYYAEHPSQQKKQVILVSAPDGSLVSFLQTQAVLPIEPEPLFAPVLPAESVGDTDDAIPSSSDIPGSELHGAVPTPSADPVDVPLTDERDLLVPAQIEPIRGVASDVSSAPRNVSVSTRPRLGAVAGGYSSAPTMVGDFFGGTFLVLNRTAATAGGDRRFKIAENTSPEPRDRLFFNYNHFENSLRDINGEAQSLDRYTFGFEKTFFDSMGSIEMRLPFARGLDSRQAFGVTDTQSTELGNFAMAFKASLLSGCDWIVSAGTTLTIPTGDDLEFLDGNRGGLLIENDAVHLAPFLGYLAQPNRSWFVQAFVQADFDLGGNDVYTSRGGYEGTIQDQNLLFIDASIGRWLCRSCDPCRGYSGIAAIAELHYTSTMNDTDDVARITNPFNRMDILNASGALNLQFGRTSVRFGGAAPLRKDHERLFDAEVIVQMSRRY